LVGEDGIDGRRGSYRSAHAARALSIRISGEDFDSCLCFV
jgi:hypothetical protein